MIRRLKQSSGLAGWALASAVFSLLMVSPLAGQDVDVLAQYVAPPPHSKVSDFRSTGGNGSQGPARSEPPPR